MHAVDAPRQPQAEQAIYRRADMRLGMRDAWPLAISVLPWGFVFGLLAQPLFSLLQTFSLSAFIHSGTAQFVALDQWGPTMSLSSLLLTVLAVNGRYLLQGASLAPWFRNVPLPSRVATLFFLTDMSWALATRRMGKNGVGLGYFLAAGATIYSAWVASTVVGFLAPVPIEQSARMGLDFAVSAALIGLAGATWVGRRSLLPWVVAAAVAALVYRGVPGNTYVIAGGVAGALAGAWRDERTEHA